MLISKKSFFIITLILNLNYNLINSFSTPKFISNLWQKNEQETINKDIEINNIKTIEIINIYGDTTIKTLNEKTLRIEAIKKGTKEELENTKISVKTVDDKVHIRTLVDNDKDEASVNYNIIVPENINVIIKNSSKGSITLKHVSGSIDLYTGEGNISISDSINMVSAKTDKGNIKLKQKSFSDSNSIFLESIKGNISVYLPKKINANIQLKTGTGSINSDIEVTINPITMKLNKDTFNDIKKEINGTLSKGGAPITIETNQGNININEY